MTPSIGLARLIASFFGCGYASIAPGSVASAATLFPGALLLHFAPAVLPAAALTATLAGLWSIRVARIEGDPGWVVIDECAGQLLALCGLAHATPMGLLSAFAVFRLLDIAKPGPVGWAERLNGATGIMGDDVTAGAFAAAILWLVRSHWPWLLDGAVLNLQ